MGRKSNATLAAEAAAEAAKVAATETQELGKIETVDGEVVVTDLEPVSGPIDADTEIKEVLEAPVASTVDPDGEDLGDVTNQPVETPVIDAGEPVVPTEPEAPVTEPVEALEQDTPATPEQEAETQSIYDQIEAAEAAEKASGFAYELEEGFSPILRPTMVGEAFTGHIPAPKAVFDAVQVEGWQELIDSHPAKHGLKSVLYWKNINGSAVVRCMSSSRFADVV